MKLMATASADGLVKIWEASRNTLIREIPIPEEIHSVCFANHRGDLLLGTQKDILIIRMQHYLPLRILRDCLDVNFSDDLLETGPLFDSNIDFWEIFLGQVEEDSLNKWHTVIRKHLDDGFNTSDEDDLEEFNTYEGLEIEYNSIVMMQPEGEIARFQKKVSRIARKILEELNEEEFGNHEHIRSLLNTYVHEEVRRRLSNDPFGSFASRRGTKHLTYTKTFSLSAPQGLEVSEPTKMASFHRKWIEDNAPTSAKSNYVRILPLCKLLRNTVAP